MIRYLVKQSEKMNYHELKQDETIYGAIVEIIKPATVTNQQIESGIIQSSRSIAEAAMNADK